MPQVTPTPVSPSELIVERAPVRVDGVVLFHLRSGGDFSAQERAALFNERLKAVVKSTEALQAEVRSYGKNSVVQLGPNVFTVTPLDAEEHQMSSEEVAYLWASKLQQAIDSARAARSPESLKRAYLQIGASFLVLLLVHILLGLHWRQKKRESEKPPSAWTLFLLRLSLWWTWGYIVIVTLPYTRYLFFPLLRAELIVSAALGCLLLVQFGLDKWLKLPLRDLLVQRGGTVRVERRADAMIRFFKGVAAALIVIVSTLATLGALGFSTTPFIASLGLVGLVLGLAAQSLVKDIVAGILILLEDKFGIGDWIEIRGFSGEVIGLSLHITTLCDLSGGITSIPNGSIDTVVNHTQDWSAIDMRTSVSHDSDIDDALQAVKAAADKLWQEHPETVVEEPRLLGVESIDDTGPSLRVIVKVASGEQWSLARELRRLLILEFQAAGVAFGRQRVQLTPGKDPGESGSESKES